jgi:transcriptional regulator with XRE-family HTH domain
MSSDEQDPETQRLITLLKVTLRILGITNRELARRLKMSPSYLSKLFSGVSELRLDHVIRICRAVELEPAEFFRLAYPRQPDNGTLAASKLRDLLTTVQVPAPPKPELGEEEIEGVLRATLAKIMGRG